MRKFATLWGLSVILTIYTVTATQFTFDIEDGADQCFYEIIKENTHCTLDFYVVSGDKHDIDLLVEGPTTHIIYQEHRKEFDSVEFNATTAGEYKFCFSNKFSTFTDKTIFLSFVTGTKDPRFEHMHDGNSSTFIELATEYLNFNLGHVIDTQTQYRLQETHGSRYANELNGRVMWWSMSLTFLVLAVGVSQVLVLRKLFDTPKSQKSATTSTAQTNFYR